LQVCAERLRLLDALMRAVEDFTHEDGELSAHLGTIGRDDYKRQFVCVHHAKESLALAVKALRWHEREHKCLLDRSVLDKSSARSFGLVAAR